MSGFVALSANSSLWEPVAKARWGSHDFCPAVESFQVWIIMQTQLNAPLPGRGKEWCRETPVGHDISFDSTKPHHQVQRVFGLTAVWAHLHQGHFQTSSGGGLQTCATGRWQHRLAICLHMAKWCHIPCAPTEWWAHQCHDGWHTQHEHPQLAPPAADMQTVAAWGQGSVPRRLKLWARCSTVHLPRAAPLGHGCSQGTLPRTAIQVPTTTLVLTHPLADTTEPPHDITMAINCISWRPWNSCSRLPLQSQPLSPSIICLGESHHQQPWGLQPQQKKQKIPSGQRDRLSHPHPDGNPHSDASADGHTRQHPQHPSCHLPPSPAHCVEDTRGSQYAIPPRIIPATLLDKLLPLQEKWTWP